MVMIFLAINSTFPTPALQLDLTCDLLEFSEGRQHGVLVLKEKQDHEGQLKVFEEKRRPGPGQQALLFCPRPNGEDQGPYASVEFATQVEEI